MKIVMDYAVEHCEGRRYALPEGGYNHHVLGRQVLAFLEGYRVPGTGWLGGLTANS